MTRIFPSFPKINHPKLGSYVIISHLKQSGFEKLRIAIKIDKKSPANLLAFFPGLIFLEMFVLRTKQENF